MLQAELLQKTNELKTKGDNASIKPVSFDHSHNTGDANKVNYRIHMKDNNPHHNQNYNRNNRFGYRNNHLSSDDCVSPGDNNTLRNSIPDGDNAPHRHRHHNRNHRRGHGNRNYYGSPNVMSDNVERDSFGNHANDSNFNNYKNDKSPVVVLNVKSPLRTNSRFKHKHR